MLARLMAIFADSYISISTTNKNKVSKTRQLASCTLYLCVTIISSYTYKIVWVLVSGRNDFLLSVATR